MVDFSKVYDELNNEIVSTTNEIKKLEDERESLRDSCHKLSDKIKELRFRNEFLCSKKKKIDDVAALRDTGFKIIAKQPKSEEFEAYRPIKEGVSKLGKK